MKKNFFKSRDYALFFIILNLIVIALVIFAAAASIRENDGFVFDFTWQIISASMFFVIVFNIHFAAIGVYSRVIVTDKEIIINKSFKQDNVLKLENVENISVLKEMRHKFRTVEVPVILIEGYDDNSKTDLSIKIDYRDYVHDVLINNLNESKKRTLKKMDKYFDEQPKI